MRSLFALAVAMLLLLPVLALHAHAAEPARNKAKKVATDDRGLAMVEKNRDGRKRVALVIGNSSYRYTDSMPKLTNPVNDANDIAVVLRRFGFEVIEKKDLTREEMDETIADFGRRIANSDAALFFYAGHGLQVRGQNYLVPVDANINTEAQVPYRAVNVNQLLEEMDSSRSRVNIVMLDACRNNPISGRFRSGASRGLAPPAVMPRGTVIVYATDPGNVAADGSGRNGVFTSGLLKAFRGSDLTLGGVLYAASKQVQDATDQQQTPYINGPATVQREFSFVFPSSIIDQQPPEVQPQQVTKGISQGTPDGSPKANGAATAGKQPELNIENYDLFNAVGGMLGSRLMVFDLSSQEFSYVMQGLENTVLHRTTPFDLTSFSDKIQALAKKRRNSQGAAERLVTTKYDAATGLRTDDEKLLYAIGMTSAKSLAVFDLNREEYEQVAKGLSDTISGIVAIDEATYKDRIQDLARTRRKELGKKNAEADQSYYEVASRKSGTTRTPSGAIYEELKRGAGRRPEATDKVKVNYRGTLPNGTEFDSSYKRGKPLEFKLDGVIKCWTEGVQLMRVGGTARLVCPASSAYGDTGAGEIILPGATLIFEIDLIDIN